MAREKTIQMYDYVAPTPAQLRAAARALAEAAIRADALDELSDVLEMIGCPV